MPPILSPVSRRLMLGAAGAALAARPSTAAPRVINGILIGKEGWLFTLGDPSAIVDPQRVKNVTGLMRQTISLFRRAGIETVVSLTPSRARLYRDMLPDGVRVTESGDRRLAIARSELGAMNVLAPDYDAPFTRQRAAQPLYFKADSHWTSYGAELAAGEMARAIRTTFRLPPSPRLGARLNPPSPATHATDLAAQLPAAEREAYPAQTFPTREEDGGSLLDDDTSDTAVVGNSFMHPRYGFSRALSYALERPVALHWQVHGNGPYRTMLHYLNGESFKANRPALLVWNLHELDLEAMPDRRDWWGVSAMPADTVLTELRRAVGA